MKERPILFSAPMVRALLDGSKTQTRRVVKPQPTELIDHGAHVAAIIDRRPVYESDGTHSGSQFVNVHCPYGQPGDRLWVRETFTDTGTGYTWRATYCQGRDEVIRWIPSIHMPRAASRILLEVVSVRVERLNDISEADARAEGCIHYEPANHLSHGGWSHDGHYVHKTAAESYKKLWECINGPGSWAANPFVWVIGFPQVTP